MRRLVALAALLLLAGPASASLIESTTSDLLADAPVDHVHYQADAGTEFDAPDTCPSVLDSLQPFDLPVGGGVDGLLIPVDDEADHYRVPIGQELVGGRVTLNVLGHDAALPFTIDAFMPACGTSVTAEENQPAPSLAHPEPAEGEKQVTPHNLANGEWTCSDRWFFVLNQFGGQPAPATIHAAWTDGSQADIALLKDTPATLAQYATFDHQDFTLDSVTANVPAGWTGQFNVAEGPCDAVDGEAVFGEPATFTDTSISFTPIEAGTYVLSVRFAPSEPELPGTSVPASCHQICAVAPTGLTNLSGYTALAS